MSKKILFKAAKSGDVLQFQNPEYRYLKLSNGGIVALPSGQYYEPRNEPNQKCLKLSQKEILEWFIISNSDYYKHQQQRLEKYCDEQAETFSQDII